MIFIVLVTQIILLGFSYIAKTKALIRRMLFVFNIWWAILLIFSEISPYGGYKISTDAYILIWLFIFVFNSVFIISKSIKNNGAQYTKEGFSNTYSEDGIVKQYDKLILENKALTFSIYIMTAMLIYYAVKYSTIMSKGSILNARNERFYVGGLFGTTLELLFYNYIVSAFRYLFSFIISFSLLYDRVKTKQFLLSVIGLALYSYVGASRFPVVLLLVSVLFLWIVRSYYKRRTINGKSIVRFIRIALVFCAGIFGMSYLTAFRRGVLGFNVNAVLDNFDILYDQMLGYSIGPLSGLSYLLDSKTMGNHWFVGRAVVLNGFEEVFTYLLSFIGINFSCAKNVLGAIANVPYNIGNRSLNALFTCIYWFFSDFGYIGVVLFSGFFALVEKKAVSRFVSKPNIFSLMLAIHLLYFMFMSNMIWQINNVDSLVYMLMIYLLHRGVKKFGYVESD